MENYVHIECLKCTYSFNEYIDNHYSHVSDFEVCEHCGSVNQITKFNEIKDTDAILDIIGEELENANYHSFTSLPMCIFDVVKDFAKPEDHVNLARRIALAIHEGVR